MSDVSAVLRRAASIYDGSYPPEVLGVVDPHINSLVPSTVSAAAAATTITVNGTNFEAGSVVEINGTAQTTTYVSPTVLTISYDPTVAATVMFTVRNPNEEESNSVPFVVGAITAREVSAMTVDDVKAFVTDHPDEAGDVAQHEAQGKARSGLLSWLDAQTVPGTGPPTEPAPEPQPVEPQPFPPPEPDEPDED